MRKRFLISIIIYVFFFSVQPVNSQGFTKITSGPVVNDSGWCYGACWADFNNDGYIDLFVVNNQTGSKNNFLYLNNGDGTFTKVTTGIIVNDDGSSYGCACADYDNDGYMDVFVSNYNENNCLYHNNGDGTFTKITNGVIVNDGGASTGCAWGDYDNDGRADLFVCNRGPYNYLYHNDGNGNFTKITTGIIVNDPTNSTACTWGDYNNDNYIDMFVANGGSTVNFLYKNNGDGTFTKITNDPVVTDVGLSGGGSWGDYNNDGYPDLFVSGGVGTTYDRLFKNNGDGSFTKITGDPIVSFMHWAGGAGWCDFNNDGWLDMFVGGYDGKNSLYVNNGNGTFTSIDTGAVVNDGNYKMGAAWGDYNNDGQIDLFVARNNYYGGNNVLYLNNGNPNNWINIKCIGVISNKAGIGAKVYVRASINSTSIRQLRVISSQTGGEISGGSMLNAAFGLGNAGIIDSIRIEWPSGIIDKYYGVPADQFITAVEGQGLIPVNKKAAKIPERFILFQNYPNPFNPSTKIKYQIPKSSFVKLIVYDILGREAATLVNEKQTPGTYEIEFDGSKYPSGVYFYKLNTVDFSETKKMVLLK